VSWGHTTCDWLQCPSSPCPSPRCPSPCFAFPSKEKWWALKVASGREAYKQVITHVPWWTYCTPDLFLAAAAFAAVAAFLPRSTQSWVATARRPRVAVHQSNQVGGGHWDRSCGCFI
jgi:hypothetical protein